MIRRPGRSGCESGCDARMHAPEDPEIDLELASRERKVQGLRRRQCDRALVHRLGGVRASFEELDHAAEIGRPIDCDFKLVIHGKQLDDPQKEAFAARKLVRQRRDKNAKSGIHGP
jgi:hypothetical protein